MRAADQIEVMRFTDEAPRTVLRQALSMSTVSWVALVDDRVAAIWGVCIPKLLGRVGYPWCLTSNTIEQHKRLFINSSRFYLDKIKELCPGGLEVYVDSEHTSSLRWLKWLGFEIGPCRDFNEHPFHYVSMREVG